VICLKALIHCSGEVPCYRWVLIVRAHDIDIDTLTGIYIDCCRMNSVFHWLFIIRIVCIILIVSLILSPEITNHFAAFMIMFSLAYFCCDSSVPGSNIDAVSQPNMSTVLRCLCIVWVVCIISISSLIK